MTRQYKMTLGSVVRKMPGDQDVIVRDYLTGSWWEHTDAKTLLGRLDYMMETRNATVYGIAYDSAERAIIVDVLED